MHLPLLGPMFTPRQEVFGVPGQVAILVVAAAFGIAGLILIRRIAQNDREGDPRSFRATDRPDATGVVTRAVALGGAAFALVLGVLLLVR